MWVRFASDSLTRSYPRETIAIRKEVTVVSRNDFQRLIEWCDSQAPFGWLRPVAGAALRVHSIVPIGTTAPPAKALWTGELLLNAISGISELPKEPVRFGGTLVGVRNPARQAQFVINADADRAVAKLSGVGIDPAWNAGFEIVHVSDESGLMRADWTLGDVGAGVEPPAGHDFPLLFELLLWPALRKAIDLGAP
jgi:hypothetical protein